MAIDPAQPVGPQMRALREQLGFSRADVAAALDRDISNLAHWERGTGPYKGGQSLALMVQYAAAIGVKEIVLICK